MNSLRSYIVLTARPLSSYRIFFGLGIKIVEIGLSCRWVNVIDSNSNYFNDKNNNGGNQRNSQFIVLIFYSNMAEISLFSGIFSPFVREKYNLNRLDCLIIFQIFR